MTFNGVDFSVPNGVTAADIKNAGYDFVCRYLSGGSAKDITASELRGYHVAGLPLVLVWETNGQMFTKADGEAAAKAAQAELESLSSATGYPSLVNAKVYFAQDIPEASGVDPVAYMQGVNSVIGLARSGIYGDYSTVQKVLDAGVAKYAWQTSGDSDGDWDSRVSLRQDEYNVQVGPASCDVDEAMVASLDDDFGQWPVPVKPAALVTVPDVMGLTGKAAKAKIKAAGLKWAQSPVVTPPFRTTHVIAENDPKAGTKVAKGTTVHVKLSY